MEIDACSLEPWQKREAGGNHLGVIGECSGTETLILLLSLAQKLRSVIQQPSRLPATRALASSVCAGHFNVLPKA